jgi:hypothetical protein
MKADPQKLASIIDGRIAEIEAIGDSIVMEMAGVAMALDKLRGSLDSVAECIKARAFEKASHIGYEDMAHNFVYVQRTLAGLQSVAHHKDALIRDVPGII